MVEAVQPGLGGRVDGGDQHRELPVDAETRTAHQVRGDELTLLTEAVDLGPAPGHRQRGRAERVVGRREGRARGDLRAARQGLGGRAGRGGGVYPVRRDVDVGRGLADPAGAVRAHPGRAGPVQLPAGPGHVGVRQPDREVGVHEAVPHHGDRRRHLDAGDVLDLVPLGQGDPAVDARKEVRLDGTRGRLQPAARAARADQDVVGRAEVRPHRADCPDLRGAGRGREYGERRGRDEHAEQQRQRAAGPEPELRPGQPAHRGQPPTAISPGRVALSGTCDYSGPYLVPMQDRYLVTM